MNVLYISGARCVPSRDTSSQSA